jgi:ketosteroid isomerase-like protein
MTDQNSLKSLAEHFTQLCREGRDKEAATQYWAEDVISLEAMEGDMARLQGKEAIFQKHDWWHQAFTVHNVDVSGPFLHGNQFTVVFKMDATDNDSQERSVMEEVALYTVRDNKIVEERFFY